MDASESAAEGKSLDDFFITLPGPAVAHGASATDARIDIPRGYLELEVQQIASLLEPINSRWARVPRLYIVLRLIDQLPLLDSTFLAQGLTDFWLPFSLGSLPDGVPLAVRSAFVRAQSVVLTKAIDLEKGERGRHRHFGPDEPLPFRSKGPLGVGGFGAVDRVVSVVSGKEYARKRLPRGAVGKGGGAGPRAKEHMKAFKAELEVLKRLRHRHTVEYVGSYTDTQHLGIIMAPVADGNLAWFLNKIVAEDINRTITTTVSSTGSAGTSLDGTTSVEKRALLRTYFGCLASALDYLHSSQIRHKDIKPQNILVMPGTGVLLTDFGLSFDWAELSRSTTKGAPAALSPRYAAPEVAEHEPRGTSADMWSLGCVFLEMVTVLKGETLEDLKAFYSSRGSESIFYRANEAANKEWIKALEGKGLTRADDIPLAWIARLLQVERKDRLSASELLEQATARDPQTGQVSRFCGSCCLPEGDSDEDDFGEDQVDEEEDGEDDHPSGSSEKTWSRADINDELLNLYQTTQSLTPDKMTSRRWWDAANKAMLRLENDPSLPPAAAGKLFRTLATLLRDASWGLVSGEITGSVPRSQEMAKEVLELIERAAMLSLPVEQKALASTPAASEREELSKCMKYISALLTDERFRVRLREAKKRLLGDDKDDDDEPSKSQAAPVTATVDPFPLHTAAHGDDLPSLTRLLASDANVDEQDDNGWTPLHHAAKAGSESCVIKLLSSGAKASAEDRDRCTPLHLASEQGNRIVVRELVKHRTVRLNAKTKRGYTPLHSAVIASNVTAVSLLLEAGASSDIASTAGRLPLSYASDGEMVQVLLLHGVDPFMKMNGGWSALHWAVQEQRVNAVAALLDAGLKASETDSEGRNALHMAVTAQDYETVKFILEKDKSANDLPVQDRNRHTTPLHIATEKGDEKMVHLLLDYGAEARFDGFSPLNIAATLGRLDLVKLFHEKGQDLNVIGADGLPLDSAALSKNLQLVRYLVEHGARFTLKIKSKYYWQKHNALHTAIEEGNEELVALLLDSLGSEAAPGMGATKKRSTSPAFTAEGNFNTIPLYLSIWCQHSAITRMLLDRGADPNGPNRVPLIAAVFKDDLDSAKLLLDFGADINKCDSNGKAAIHHCSAASVAMAELLVARGADVNQPAEDPDHTAVYWALMDEKPDILAYLVEKTGAKVHDSILGCATHRERGGMMATLLSRPEQIVPAFPTPERLNNLLAQAGQGDSAAVGALLKVGAAGKAGLEALSTAIHRNNIANVAALIEAGVDPRGNVGHPYVRTPEKEALGQKNTVILQMLLESEKARGQRTRKQVLQEWLRYSGRSVGHEMVKWLYEQGASGNVHSRCKYAPPGYMQSPLQWAADNDDLEMVRDRLARGDDISGIDVCHTPVQFAARNGNAEILKLLLDHGAAKPPRSADDYGLPPGIDTVGPRPLLSAVQAHSVQCVHLLLAAGADPNLDETGRDKKISMNWLPLAEAVKGAAQHADDSDHHKAYMDIVNALLEAGADPVKSSSSYVDALSVVCAEKVSPRQLQLLRLLLDYCQGESIKTGGLSALFTAARGRRIEFITMLLDRGVDIEAKPPHESEPLLWVCTTPGNEEIVRFLVQRGADPDKTRNRYGTQSVREKAQKTYDTLLIDAMDGE
ncbi:Ankyrin-3 [Arthrobotrys entomopaga]|nr:Ankyrin-3 [Arthrobotrys entomopaga]